MAADGTITLTTKIDQTGIKTGVRSVRGFLDNLKSTAKKTGDTLKTALGGGSAEQAKLAADIKAATAEIQKQESALEELQNRLIALSSGEATGESKQTKQLTAELSSTEKEMQKIAAEMDKVNAKADRLRDTAITIDGETITASAQEYNSLIEKSDELGAKYTQLADNATQLREQLRIATGEATQKEMDALNVKIEQTSSKLEKAKAKAQTLGDKFSGSVQKSKLGIEAFNKRIAALAKRVFVFTVITKALRQLKSLFAATAKTNGEYNSAVAMLNDNLWALYSVLQQYVMPIIIKIAQTISLLAQNAVSVLARLLGKSTAELIASGKALKKQTQEMNDNAKATKKATQALASFDEVNTLNTTEDTDTVSTFKAADLSAGVSGALNAVLLAAGGFLAVLGIILICTGHIGTGIGFLLAGAAIFGIQAATMDWNNVPDKVKKTLAIIAEVTADLLIAVGLIICLCPNGIALGIGLLISGFAMKYAEATLGDKLPEDVKRTIAKVNAIVGGALIAIGLILCLTGAGIPMGIGLIIAGATMEYTAYSMSTSETQEKVRDIVSKILAIAGGAEIAIGLLMCLSGLGLPVGIAMLVDGYLKVKGATQLSSNPIVTKVKDTVNAVISVIEKGINYVIKQLNKVGVTLPDWFPFGGGKRIGFNISTVSIPRLAQGAVLPANKPFVAQLGDQKNGRNLEAPESLLRDIYEQGNSETNDLLRQLIQVMSGGMSVNINGREIMRANRDAEQRYGAQIVKGAFANAY